MIDYTKSVDGEDKKIFNISNKIGLFVLENLVWLLIILFFAFFGIFVENFFTPRVFNLILYLSSPIGILVLAQSLCLLSGNFDLSLAQNAGFSALLVGIIIGRVAPNLIPVSIAIILVPIIAGIFGAINGYFVGILRINSFLVTLSTYLIFQSMGYYVLSVPISRIDLPEAFLFPGGGKVGPIYFAFVLFLIIAIILYFILRHTRFGVKVYSVGSDYEASSSLGIKSHLVVFWVYVIAGILAGIAGLLYVGFSGAVTNSLASGEVFWTFAGAIIGGISMRGGRGKIIGAMGGAILLGILSAGVIILDLNPNLRNVVKGFVVLAAVLIGKYRIRFIDKLLMPHEKTKIV